MAEGMQTIDGDLPDQTEPLEEQVEEKAPEKPQPKSAEVPQPKPTSYRVKAIKGSLDSYLDKAEDILIKSNAEDGYQKALEQADAALNNDPKNQRAYLLKANALIALRNPNEAYDLLKDNGDKNDLRTLLVMHKARVCYAPKCDAEVVDLFEEILDEEKWEKAEEVQFKTCRRQADFFKKNQQMIEAADCLEKAVALNPSDPDALFELLSLDMTSNTKFAETSYKNAIGYLVNYLTCIKDDIKGGEVPNIGTVRRTVEACRPAVIAVHKSKDYKVLTNLLWAEGHLLDIIKDFEKNKNIDETTRNHELERLYKCVALNEYVIGREKKAVEYYNKKPITQNKAALAGAVALVAGLFVGVEALMAGVGYAMGYGTNYIFDRLGKDTPQNFLENVGMISYLVYGNLASVFAQRKKNKETREDTLRSIKYTVSRG
jgi:tetratricopeptide (TPR) repeat protein